MVQQYKLGALAPKKDIRDFKYQPAQSTQVELPECYNVWTPPVKNQGNVGSCVAHTSAEIEEYFNHKEGNDFNTLSPGYIYGCRYDYTGEGMYLRDALKTLKNRGVCEKQEFPYNKEVPEIIELFKEKDKEGFATDRANVINSYFAIDTNNSKDIKKCIMDCGPVMASIPWYDNFSVDKNGKLSGAVVGNYGYHCIYIYGWNENGWLILNSWGKDWGNNGTFIYPYNYKIAEAWGIIDTENNSDLISKPLSHKCKIVDVLYKIANFCINIFQKN